MKSSSGPASKVSINRRNLMRSAAASIICAPAISLLKDARADESTLRIGWVRPTTGKLASSFAPLYAGGDIALAEINAAGGILGRKLVIHEEDDEASPAKEPGVVKKLQDSGINVLVGPTGSSQVLASLAFTTPARIIQCGVANGSVLGDAQKNPYHYMCVYTTEQEGMVAAKYMIEQIKLKKIGILHESTPFGEDAARASRQTLKDLANLEPAGVQSYPMSAIDLSVYIRNLQAAGCDGIIAWMASNTHIAMAFNAMAQLKWFPHVVGHVNLFNDGLFDLVPPETLRNVYGVYYRGWTYTDQQPVSDRHLALANHFLKIPAAKGIEAYIAGCPQYDFLYLLKAVIEQEKSFDSDTIKRALDNVKGFKGLLGTFNFSPTNHAGVSLEDITLASVASGRDPRSISALRERAPGA
ncbi:ABC transporter substrate-binding protein [Bradyrhizobium jicamae]|uniref:ABC transporter substrate-binding protein n=1 Tax=Bradyrhizobium jicamae TaxID=280332 RepID=A0ABS5FS24_9BRAD|nr:ABC transporter substrate-binding protein [Bradyrhizobium jicamae]MBR0799623.1 ABC transporter substrate-binding protein [Bradyrhizobium jicamae]